MINQILLPIREHLQKIQATVDSSFKTRAGHLNYCTDLTFSPIDLVIRPALVILSALLLGPVTAQVLTLAVVLQFIYIATKIHNNIREDSFYTSKNNNPRNGYQFDVLIGDYLYSKCYASLCEADLVKYVSTLSKILCYCNEASILRLKYTQGQIPPHVVGEIIQKETAELFAAACWMGGELAGAKEDRVNTLSNFGLNLGMAIGILEENLPAELAKKYLDQAMAQLPHLPAGIARDVLEQLVNLFLVQIKEGVH